MQKCCLKATSRAGNGKMGEQILYKYLDITGAKCMIGNSNLQFTNATQLNDPFDCHPNLIDFDSKTKDSRPGIHKQWAMEIEENRAFNRRNDTWLCSLSKINDSILMWSHYCRNHSGVCIGLNMGKVRESYPPLFGSLMIHPVTLEVQYQDLIEHHEDGNSWFYQWQTKAKPWEYEQEVRLVIAKPSGMYAALTPEQAKRKDIIDWKEIRHYLPLKGECFESIYFGINTKAEDKEKIINYALTYVNPNLKVYQMTVDEKAFRLKPVLEDAKVTKKPRKIKMKSKKIYKTFRMM